MRNNHNDLYHYRFTYKITSGWCQIDSSDVLKGGYLKGITVIDFGQYIAGPLVASNLADQGANVIHIDPDNDCKICEFTSGTETDGLKIQAIKPFVKNYNRLYNNMISTFSDYYFIPFLKSSTKKETEIDVKNLKFFLNIV